MMVCCPRSYDAKTFKALQDWLDGLPNQDKANGMTLASAVSFEVLEEEVVIDTPENRDHAEMVVASRIKTKLAEIFALGRVVVWHVPLEHTVGEVFIRDDWDRDGECYDPFENRNCTLMLGKFAAVRAYCRVSI